MREARLAILLVAIGVIAMGAHASEFTGAESSDWFDANNWTAGIPGAAIGAEIGTAANADVSAVISGTTAYANGLQVGVGGNGSLELVNKSLMVVGTRLNIGVSGGTAVTANVVFNGDVSCYSGIYNEDEDEIHSLDIGGGAKANVTIAAGVSVIAASGIGIGKDDRWQGGYETHVSMGEGSLLQSGAVGGEWVQFGLGGDVYPMVLSMQNNATIEGTLFHLGGTLEVNGTANLNGGSRWRNLNAPGFAGGLNPIIKLIGEGANILTYGFQFGLMPKVEGPRLDVSELVIPADTWVTVMTDQDGGFWGNKDIDFVPGTPSYWQMQLIAGTPSTEEPHYVQVMVPEPATLVLLVLGGLGVLLRKRR